MELLDRYLKTVGTYLPKPQRADILRELSENIRSQMEDREMELGRPLNEAEQEAILKQVGNPLVVAGRFQKDQRTVAFGRQLIGPALFPLYAKVLCVNLAITLVICITAAVVLADLGKSVTGFGTVPAILFQLLLQFSIITVIFTVAESSLGKNGDRWSPREPSSALPMPQGTRRVFTSLVELVIGLVFLFWWISARSYVPGILSSLGSGLRAGPGLHVMYLAILILTLAGIALSAFTLFSPQETALSGFARAAIDGLFLAVLCVSIVVGHWVVLGEASGQASQVSPAVVEKLNEWIRLGLIVTAGGAAIQLVFEIRRIMNRRQNLALPEMNSLASRSL
ncbi:MAG: hypothetical protein WBW33_04280 [Bryobacteraceae bacterium]